MAGDATQWLFAAVLGGIFIIWGLALFLATDRIADWQIRQLQSPKYRLNMRIVGLALIPIGAILAWQVLTGKFP